MISITCLQAGAGASLATTMQQRQVTESGGFDYKSDTERKLMASGVLDTTIKCKLIALAVDGGGANSVITCALYY